MYVMYEIMSALSEIVEEVSHIPDITEVALFQNWGVLVSYSKHKLAFSSSYFMIGSLDETKAVIHEYRLCKYLYHIAKLHKGMQTLGRTISA